MARESQIQTTAHAISGDCRVNGRGKSFYRGHKSLPDFRKFVSPGTVQGSDLRQFGARREESLVSGDDEWLRFPLQMRKLIGQREDALPRQTVRPIIGS